MKNRRAAFTLALCLVNSLSFADNPTDAPLVVSDPFVIAQQDAQQDQSTKSIKRHADKNKSDKCAPQQTAQGAAKRQNPKAQQDRQTPAQRDLSPTM